MPYRAVVLGCEIDDQGLNLIHLDLLTVQHWDSRPVDIQ